MRYQEAIQKQGVMYRPTLSSNQNIGKRFSRKRHEIFESLNLRGKLKSDRKSVEYGDVSQSQSRPFSKAPLKTAPLQLPNIYMSSKSRNSQIVSIEDKQKLLKIISSSLTFINKKTLVLTSNIIDTIKQKTKPMAYDSQQYGQQLQILNSIFNECGILLKVKDIIVIQGEASKNKFSVFTNQQKHPQSLCCESEVIFKHIDFMSAKNFKFTQQKSTKTPIKSLILISCLKCGQDIIKIRPLQKFVPFQSRLNQYQEQRKLLNYSKLISSGRFKKSLINDESVQLMKSRNLSLIKNRKETITKQRSRVKLQQISFTDIMINKDKYRGDERSIRVQSQQATAAMLKNKQQKAKRNNISTLLIKKQPN